ncbi:hypothetical protein AL035_04535 [Salipiger aestuarii]|nr:hypothetical protein AL035_04535 [Salipiger aestuarii]
MSPPLARHLLHCSPLLPIRAQYGGAGSLASPPFFYQSAHALLRHRQHRRMGAGNMTLLRNIAATPCNAASQHRHLQQHPQGGGAPPQIPLKEEISRWQ